MEDAVLELGPGVAVADCSACARDCRRRLPDIMAVSVFVDSLLFRVPALKLKSASAV